VLNGHPFTQKVFSIEFVNSVISVAVIFKLDKPESLFDQNVSLATIALEKSVQVLLPAIRRQIPDVDSAAP